MREMKDWRDRRGNGSGNEGSGVSSLVLEEVQEETGTSIWNGGGEE